VAEETASAPDAESDDRSQGASFYHDPLVWVGKSPLRPPVPGQQVPDVDLSLIDDVVYEGHAGPIDVTVLCEGLFSFGFVKWPDAHLAPLIPTSGPPAPSEESVDAILNRTTVMNAFLALLYTEAISANRMLPHRMVVTPETIIGGGFGTPYSAHLFGSRFPGTYRQGPPFADFRMRRNFAWETELVANATERLGDLIDQGGADSLLLADLFLRASKAAQDHNHSAALIDYWAITERLLQEAWDQYKDENAGREDGAFISRARGDRLKDGRTFTAAVIIEMLSFAERIPFELYERLGRVRKARNDWMHELKRPSAEDVAEATRACESLLRLVRGVTLNGTVSRQIHS
jgi:hypothetical protein